MKVLLTQDVPGLGLKGSVVDVKEGYARNYLIPKGFAKNATEGALKALKDELLVKEKKAEREHREAQKAAKALDGARVEIAAHAGEHGRLFGAVTAKDISEAIAQRFGIHIDKKKIDLNENIKSVGVYKVKVKLHPDVAQEVEVLVTASARTGATHSFHGKGEGRTV
ncbi:MAG TPA: 50S ribosomal protein L9 [Clostridia bacterium]|nr:50S ribosomal protein L9 [Clostridia bacterium]